MAEIAFIELGSNVEPEHYLPLAVGRLTDLGRVIAVSAAYENPAIGPSGQPDFVNLAVSLEVELSPHDLRAALRQVENEFGRQRNSDRYAARVIDLDLCLYGSHVAEDDGLRVPDPDILERGYLAQTLAELDPDFIHPTTGQPLAEIASHLNRSSSELKARPDLELAIARALQAS